ncbi:Lipoprotein signal peptidase [gamma proteobacterium HdN1]|nr:Lipoprotein signal peptidase [gamma proteobacterium HdN1]
MASRRPPVGKATSQDTLAESTKSPLVWLWLSGLVILLDQITKLAITELYAYGDSTSVWSFFNIVRAHNYGAAFSFLAGESGWQRWFFAAIAVGVSVMLVQWLRKLPRDDWFMAVALSLVLGGALGNLIDRIVLGYVVDFLDFFWSGYHFPAFNIADSAITVGACMLGLDILRQTRKKPEGKS